MCLRKRVILKSLSKRKPRNTWLLTSEVKKRKKEWRKGLLDEMWHFWSEAELPDSKAVIFVIEKGAYSKDTDLFEQSNTLEREGRFAANAF